MQTNNKMAVAPVGKLIWQMSIPPLISMFLQYSYNLIDSAFVARLSENALTAVSLSFPITTLMNATSIWIGVGVNVLIAGYLGQRKQNEANTTVTHGLLPSSYTVIGEGGGTLSGGEKQRISIARAMLKDAPIIILDEATSSVDPENEDELQRAIEALTHDKTIIMIAHRLKTVRNADQILVLDNAHIVQRGTHAELIQQKGLYADFVSARQEAIGWKLAQ